MQGIETFVGDSYCRSFALNGHAGLITVTPDDAAQGMRVTLSAGLQPVAEACLARVARLFDLSCDPQQIALTLGSLALPRPGLRLPGSLDAFEQAVRAVLGQLVSVAMAAKLTGKVVAAFGEPLTDAPGFYLFPSAPAARGGADPPGAGGYPRRSRPLRAGEYRRRNKAAADAARDRPLDGELFRAARLAGAGYLPGG